MIDKLSDFFNDKNLVSTKCQVYGLFTKILFWYQKFSKFN
jgi:hypothetical protein